MTLPLSLGAARQLAHSRSGLSIKGDHKLKENPLESHSPVLSLVRVDVYIFKAMITCTKVKKAVSISRHDQKEIDTHLSVTDTINGD